MGLSEKFPQSPYAILDPDLRWYPAEEERREKGYAALLAPLVDKVRRAVKSWRDRHYHGVSDTSRTLLEWWFQTDHAIQETPFQYYFSQREAIESIIYLYEVVGVRSKYDLSRYDSSGVLGKMTEHWLRLVIKMATGTGKTKVMSLLIAWSYFHKLYEENSELARNFLLITPNIIVLDRLKTDFVDLKIFFEDPILPDNGVGGQNWKDDFQITLHMQDDISTISKTGNLFLTNIHRIYNKRDTLLSVEDANTMEYFLGPKSVAKTSDSKINLGEIARDLDELVILNDEAHHIHDEKLAWFQSIEDIVNTLKMKTKSLSLQIDFTATPKHSNGSIFVQTVSDYPLVEAIYQNVVKHPTLPDSASLSQLSEKPSVKFTEKYKDYIDLGYREWEKAYDECQKMDKKAVLFIMTDDTKNCDEVEHYLQSFPKLKDAVLTIHTKNNGEIKENGTGKKEQELKLLRNASNTIDTWNSQYKAIVSVLMLKEGWNVKNVTTIVGLRPYDSKSQILPEQTLGRGLRRMFNEPKSVEYVSVIGTDPFINFVESIRARGRGA